MPQPKPRITIEVTEASDVEVRSAEAQEKYLREFLKPREVKSNTKVYLYPEIHAVLSRMVKTLNLPGVSIGSYASEIILNHFANHQSVMQGLFDKNREDLF